MLAGARYDLWVRAQAAALGAVTFEKPIGGDIDEWAQLVNATLLQEVSYAEESAWLHELQSVVAPRIQTQLAQLQEMHRKVLCWSVCTAHTL